MARIEFKGKAFIQNYHLQVKYHELVPVKSKSLTQKVSLHDNLIIHGDNLKALKALLPMYAGKVKCIYIDPPYNTGNENWVYNDNVNSPMMPIARQAIMLCRNGSCTTLKGGSSREAVTMPRIQK